MTTAAKVRLVVGLSLPLAALAYFGWDLYLVSRVPDAADWQQAAAVVRQGYKPGDIVTFAPAWAQEGAPLFSGLDTVTAETVDPYVLRKHPRVWVVASLAGRGEALPQGFTRVAHHEFARMDVSLYASPPGELRYDFLERLSEGRVTRIYPHRREECQNYRNQRWYCGGVHDWQYVGRAVRDIASAVREVIWMHPLDRGQRLELRYAGVPLAGRLVIHYGYTQRAVEDGGGKPVTFSVRLGDRVVFERSLETDRAGWFEQEIDVSRFGGADTDVTFSVVTPDFKLREFCFTADLWQAR